MLAKIKSVIKVVSMNVLVTALVVLLIEFAVRLFVSNLRTQGTDIELLESDVYGQSTGLAKNTVGKSFGKIASTNDYRFRKTKKEATKGKKGKLLIGDSVTFGVGMEDGETFPSLYEAISDQTVFNPSVLGWNIEDYANALEKVLDYKELEFQSITVFYCLNDISLSTSNATMASHNNPFGFVFEFLKRNSATYIYLKHLFFDRSAYYFLNDSSLYKKDEHVKALAEEISRIKTMAREKNIALRFVLLPYEFQLRTASDDVFYPQTVVKNLLEKEALTYFDASSFLLKNYGKQEMYLKADGIHFSAVGHEKIAEYLQLIFTQ